MCDTLFDSVCVRVTVCMCGSTMGGFEVTWKDEQQSSSVALLKMGSSLISKVASFDCLTRAIFPDETFTMLIISNHHVKLKISYTYMHTYASSNMPLYYDNAEQT